MKLEWLKLADFGQYSHPKGLQVLNEKSANAIIDSFRSIRGRLMRKFLGLPIYIGHPDDKDFLSKSDRIYGRIENFKIEGSALWALIKWTAAGSALFKNGILRYLSPRWMTVPIEGGKLMPKRMISVGLTNHPNIRCEHISKFEELEQRDEKSLKCDINDEILIQEEKSTGKHEQSNAIEQNIEPKQDDECANVEKNVFADDGISAVECSQLGHPDSKFVQTDGPSEYQKLCLPGKILLHTVSQTSDLKFSNFQKSNGDKILELVFERMQNFSEQYNEAWSAVRRSNPSLFEKIF